MRHFVRWVSQFVFGILLLSDVSPPRADRLIPFYIHDGLRCGVKFLPLAPVSLFFLLCFRPMHKATRRKSYLKPNRHTTPKANSKNKISEGSSVKTSLYPLKSSVYPYLFGRLTLSRIQPVCGEQIEACFTHSG